MELDAEILTGVGSRYNSFKSEEFFLIQLILIPISEDYAKSTGFQGVMLQFYKKKKQMLDGGIAGAWDLRKHAKSSISKYVFVKDLCCGGPSNSV